MNIPRELKQIIKEKLKEGWTYVKNGHIKLTHPKGGCVIISSSPSCPFYLSHVKQDIRRLERKHLK